MMTLEQIRQALKDRRLAVVGEAVGLSSATLIRVRDNLDHNPSYRVIEALSLYLEKGAGGGKKGAANDQI